MPNAVRTPIIISITSVFAARFNRTRSPRITAAVRNAAVISWHISIFVPRRALTNGLILNSMLIPPYVLIMCDSVRHSNIV